MTRTYLSLGSNLGDRLGLLVDAARRLNVGNTRVLRCSSVYETAPQGLTDQPSFLNLVVEATTDLAPRALLEHVRAIEQDLGRLRLVRWGPRTVDIDILLFGEWVSADPDLTVPHPRLAERAFVLVPLLELRPDLSLPGPAGLPLSRCLSSLADQGVRPFCDAASFTERLCEVE